MSILDEALAEVRVTGNPCAMRKAHAEFPELAAQIDEAVYSTVTAAAVMRALAKHGIKINDWAIQKHRRGECEACRSSTTPSA